MAQRSTLVLVAIAAVAALLIVLNPPTSSVPAPATGIAPATAGALPEGHPPLGSAVPAAATEGPFATVLETMDSGGYTYARVAVEGEEVWVAGPPTPLTEGAEVSLAGAMGMENFRAASLDRTFDRILFVNAFQAPASSSASASATASAFGDGAAGRGTVLEATHAAGYTYLKVEQAGEELWLAGEQLDVEVGQDVAWEGGNVMRAFASPSLGRTFDRILFAVGLRVEG